MSLKKSLGVVATCTAVAVTLYGVGCGSSSGGKGTGDGGGGTAGSSAGSGGAAGTGGSSGTGGSGGKGGSMGSGGTSGISPFEGGMEGGGSCTPGSVSGVTFGLNPSAIAAGGCTKTQLANIINDCQGGNPDASMTTCSDLLADSATKQCYLGCFFSAWTASISLTTYTPNPWGSFVYPNQYLGGYIDIGGCIVAATTGTSMAAAGKKCATDIEESLECQLQACTGNCPIPKPSTGNCSTDPACAKADKDFGNCLTSANAGDCAKYGTAAGTDCATVAADSGPLFDCTKDLNDLVAGPAAVDGGAPVFYAAFTQFVDLLCTGSVD